MADNAKTGIELAKEAAQSYGKFQLTAQNPRLIRRAGGAHFFMYQVTGSPEAMAAYKAVMSQVAVPGSRNGSALVEDNATGGILFPQPTGANGRKFTIVWSSGNPDVNPLGRFVADDANRLIEQDIQMETMVSQEQAKILAARRLGLAPRLNEPRGNSNQTAAPELSAEEIEAAMRAGENDAQ